MGISKNAQYVYDTLIQQYALPPAKASAITAQFMSESYGRIDPNALNTKGGGQGAYGIAQWRGTRQDNLRAFSDERGAEVSDLGNQLAFFMSEEGGPDGRQPIANMGNDPYRNVEVYDERFARSKGSNIPRAKGFLPQVMQYGDASAALRASAGDSGFRGADAYANLAPEQLAALAPTANPTPTMSAKNYMGVAPTAMNPPPPTAAPEDLPFFERLQQAFTQPKANPEFWSGLGTGLAQMSHGMPVDLSGSMDDLRDRRAKEQLTEDQRKEIEATAKMFRDAGMHEAADAMLAGAGLDNAMAFGFDTRARADAEAEKEAARLRAEALTKAEMALLADPTNTTLQQAYLRAGGDFTGLVERNTERLKTAFDQSIAERETTVAEGTLAFNIADAVADNERADTRLGFDVSEADRNAQHQANVLAQKTANDAAVLAANAEALSYTMDQDAITNARNATNDAYSQTLQTRAANLADAKFAFEQADSERTSTTKLVDYALGLDPHQYSTLLEVTNANSGGGGMTDGETAMDKAYAPLALEWMRTGGADIAWQIGQVNDVLQRFVSGDTAMTGKAFGATPDILKPFLFPEQTDAKNVIEGVVQRSLKATLGAQFSKVEGENLVKRAYNPALPPEVNAARVSALLDKLNASAQAQEAMYAHFMEHGTLSTYTGPAAPDISYAALNAAVDAMPETTIGMFMHKSSAKDIADNMTLEQFNSIDLTTDTKGWAQDDPRWEALKILTNKYNAQ